MGKCSLTVALPIISACGVETAVLPSAILSTHTGGFSGFAVAADGGVVDKSMLLHDAEEMIGIAASSGRRP